MKIFLVIVHAVSSYIRGYHVLCGVMRTAVMGGTVASWTKTWTSAWTECDRTICLGSEEGFLRHRWPSFLENYSSYSMRKRDSYQPRYRAPTIFSRSGWSNRAHLHVINCTSIDFKEVTKYDVYGTREIGKRRNITRATNHCALQKQCEFNIVKYAWRDSKVFA